MDRGAGVSSQVLVRPGNLPFSEQIPQLTTLFARRTPLVIEQLAAITPALAARANARMAGWTCSSGVIT